MPDQFKPRAQALGFSGLRLGFAFWVGTVVLFAFLIREYFVLATIVDIPIRGDIREYVLYAWNLYHHGIFSMAPPQWEALPIPDAYRSPGYPWLLTLSMYLRPSGNDWYVLALQMQVLLGTATVWLTILLGRHWLNQGWALAAGALLALWPHHVAATGALLSEVAFGFTLMAGLYWFATAMEQSRQRFFVLAAIAFGYAYLINPLIALFPPVLALWAWRDKGRRLALVFIAIFLIPVLGFALRNAQLDQSALADEALPGRAAINFVQGSWPQYHQAWQAQRFGDPIGVAIIREINTDTKLISERPVAGIKSITRRLASDPVYYGSWYLWRKPLLLWDWEIRMGPGGPYVLVVRNSPLQTHPLLRICSGILRTLNPLLTLSTLAGMLCLAAGSLLRKGWAPPAAVAPAALALYLTAIHLVFQAEPRYANAYRGIESILVMGVFAWTVAAAQRLWNGRIPQAPTTE